MSKKNVELERTAQKISENGQSFAQLSDSVLDAARQQAEAILAEAKVQADQKYASIVGVQRTDPLEAYRADELLLTCEGEVLETGHNVYDLPLTFFAEGQAG